MKPTYKCLSKLGRGAYATVWLAVDQSSGFVNLRLLPLPLFTRGFRERVAIKVVSEAKFFAAAVHESNITSGLAHPNIITTRAWFVVLKPHYQN